MACSLVGAFGWSKRSRRTSNSSKLHVGGHDAEDLVRVVPGRHGRPGWGAVLAPVDPGHDVAPDADGVVLVDGEVVRQPGDPRVHLGAAQRLVVGFLAGGHLHQRRPAEEHLRLPVHQDRVVAHAGHVGAARGRVAEHQRHGGHRVGGQFGELKEDPAGRDEQVGLRRQVRAARFHQVHHRQPVGAGDLQRAQRLAQRVRVRSAPWPAADPGRGAAAGSAPRRLRSPVRAVYPAHRAQRAARRGWPGRSRRSGRRGR